MALDNLIIIESKVAGEIRRFQAEITAQEIRAGGVKMCKITLINPESGKKSSGALSESQLLSLQPQNRVRENPNLVPGKEVREFEDLRLWQQYFQNEKTLGIRYQTEATTNLKIIRRPESPTANEN